MRHSWMKRTVAFAVSLLLCAQPVMAGAIEPVGGGGKTADAETAISGEDVTPEETATGISVTEQPVEDAANVEETVTPEETGKLRETNSSTERENEKVVGWI